MLFNVNSPQAKAQAQRKALRMMLAIEKGFRRTISISLNAAVREAAALLENGVDNLDVVVNNQWLLLNKAFRTAYKRAGASFSQEVFNSVNELKGMQALEVKQTPEVKGMGEEFWNAFLGFTELNTASRVTQVNSFTKRWIADKVRAGTELGKSPGEIAKDLRKSGKFNKMRAARIARTEVHMASNFATQESVKSSRLEMDKEWVAFIDDRTRNTHVVMNSKRISMKDNFIVDGAKMDYPGDPKGGARNVVNCRCVLLYFKATGTVTVQQPATSVNVGKPSTVIVQPNADIINDRIDVFASKTHSLSYERAEIYDTKGNILLRKKGDRNSITFTKAESDLCRGNILVHNHPVCGGSFTSADIISSMEAGEKELWAVGKNYKYSFQRTLGKNLSYPKGVDRAKIEAAYKKHLYSPNTAKQLQNKFPETINTPVNDLPKNVVYKMGEEVTHITMDKLAKELGSEFKYTRLGLVK